MKKLLLAFTLSIGLLANAQEHSIKLPSGEQFLDYGMLPNKNFIVESGQESSLTRFIRIIDTNFNEIATHSFVADKKLNQHLLSYASNNYYYLICNKKSLAMTRYKINNGSAGSYGTSKKLWVCRVNLKTGKSEQFVVKAPKQKYIQISEAYGNDDKLIVTGGRFTSPVSSVMVPFYAEFDFTKQSAQFSGVAFQNGFALCILGFNTDNEKIFCREDAGLTTISSKLTNNASGDFDVFADISSIPSESCPMQVTDIIDNDAVIYSAAITKDVRTYGKPIGLGIMFGKISGENHIDKYYALTDFDSLSKYINVTAKVVENEKDNRAPFVKLDHFFKRAEEYIGIYSLGDKESHFGGMRASGNTITMSTSSYNTFSAHKALLIVSFDENGDINYHHIIRTMKLNCILHLPITSYLINNDGEVKILYPYDEKIAEVTLQAGGNLIKMPKKVTTTISLDTNKDMGKQLAMLLSSAMAVPPYLDMVNWYPGKFLVVEIIGRRMILTKLSKGDEIETYEP